MLRGIPYNPDQPVPRQKLGKIAQGFLALLLAFCIVAFCVYLTVQAWDELLLAFLERRPVVTVDFGSLGLIAALPGVIAGTAMVGITLLGYFLRWKLRIIERLHRRLNPFTWLGLVLMLGTWAIGGPLASTGVSSAGYLHCSALSSDIGIGYYRRTYVQHPFLCVDEEQLPEQLALYDQLAAAQRAGRLREAIIDAGMTVNENGHIVRAAASRSQ